tara:strand:+ start:1331 stop:2788 length:1458 start_codon:yes stop_codon:yes gene_type:complete
MQYTVIVQDYDGDNKFKINSLRQKVIDAAPGEEIVFDQSDASNAGHPLKIALYPDGAHLGGGSEYTAGVVVEGTPGQAGAKTTFTVSDANLHGTYFYYCESHQYMGGMIHYGSNDPLPDEVTPAKYRLVDEGANAYDAQDEDVTSSIKKIVEEYDASLDPPWRVVYDSNLILSDSHTNPWAVINTDTRNTVKYRIKYNVQDSAGAAAYSKHKSINISQTYSPPLADLAPGETAYLDGQVFTVTYGGAAYVFRQTFLILHPDRVELSWLSLQGYDFNFALAGIYNSTTDEFTVHDHQFGPFEYGAHFYPYGTNNINHPNIEINGPAVFGGQLAYLHTVNYIWGSSVGFTGELVDFDIKARRFSSAQIWEYSPTNPSGTVNVYYGDFSQDASVDKPLGMRASLMDNLVWNRKTGTDFAGNGLPDIKPPPGLNKTTLSGSSAFTPVSKYINDYGWVQLNGYLVPPDIKSSSIQPYFAGGEQHYNSPLI